MFELKASLLGAVSVPTYSVVDRTCWSPTCGRPTGFLCSQDIEIPPYMQMSQQEMATCVLHVSPLLTHVPCSIVPLDFTSKIHSRRLRTASQQQQSTKRSMGWRHRSHTHEPSPVYILHFIKGPSFFQNSRWNFLDSHVKDEIHSISQTVFPYFALFSPSFIFASLTLGFTLETTKSFQYFLKLYSAIPIPTSHPKFCPARTQSLVEGVPSYPYHSSKTPWGE